MRRREMELAHERLDLPRVLPDEQRAELADGLCERRRAERLAEPLDESGRRGAELLLRALAGEQLTTSAELLPLELVVRGTTAPPPRQP
ncbi:MAG: hypothetical protein ACJ757_03360 [Gaiellaceae bacterium]